MGRAPGQAIDLQNLTGAGGVTVERPVQLQDLAHSQPGRQLACLQLDTDHTVQDSAVCQQIKANTPMWPHQAAGAPPMPHSVVVVLLPAPSGPVNVVNPYQGRLSQTLSRK